MTGPAYDFGTKAKEIAELMERECPGWKSEVNGRSNVKPWYSPVWMFGQPVSRVFVGAVVGGEPVDPDDTTVLRGWEQERGVLPPFNALLDESWEGEMRGDAKLQRAVQRVFRIIYGASAWQSSLRETACFNVCPIRAGHTKLIPDTVWDRSVKWFRDVLEQLGPAEIIMDGVSERSPLSALTECGYAVQIEDEEPLGNSSVRFGTVSGGHLNRATLLAIPFLNRSGSWKKLPTAVGKHRDRFAYPIPAAESHAQPNQKESRR